jgi:outer membrane phospholipase A
MFILFFHTHLGPSKRFFPSKLVKRYYARKHIHTQVNMCSIETYSTSVPYVQLKKYTDKSKNVNVKIRISRKSILLENILTSKT